MLCATLALAAVLSFAQSDPATPSGRPPIGPLQRTEPRIYDFTFEVFLSTFHDDPPHIAGSAELVLKDAPVVLPIVFQSTFSSVDRESMRAQLFLDGREDTSLASRLRLDVSQPFGTQLAVVPVKEFRGTNLRWQVHYRAQVYSSQIDEAAAAKLTWPRDWPKEVEEGLKPQFLIESDDPIFAKAVAEVTQGKLRTVPPYLAAKELVRYCILNFQIQGSANRRGMQGALRHMLVNGASKSAAEGKGNANDLVCMCVATLRAAGIPARPVIGMQDNERGYSEFVTWAEFYLHGAGWVPFDPEAMKGKGLKQLKANQPWPEFGTMKDLNRRIPLAFAFMPPSTQSPGGPAVWGWDPRPMGDCGVEPTVKLSTTSRGRAPETPR